MEVLQYPLALIVTLGILVTIHELGHYLVARLSGVTITRFAVGFGRPLWARMDARGTEWVIAAIPLGGYVRMLDERELPRGDSVPAGSLAFNQLTPAWRIAIAAAGPAANFVLALVVYWILSIMGSVNAAPLLGPLQPEDAIAQAGGQVGEEIRAVDGVQTRSWQQVSVALAARLGESGAIELELRRPGSTRSRTIDVPIQDWHQGESDPPLLESLGINPLLPPMIGQVVGDSPAAAAGLRVGDLPLTVEAEAVPSWRSFVAAIQARPGKRLSLTVDRDGRQVALTVVPESRTAEGATEPSGYLGVGPPMNELTFGPLAAVGNAIDETIAKTGLTLGLLKKMVVGQVSVQNL
ncbi:MAG: RIP metalloprotease RseP, partial [Pseudomonadota bacterium]